MFSNTHFAAVAVALLVSGLAGAAHAYDAFGGGDREAVIRQSAQSPLGSGMTNVDDRFTVGRDSWTGDRDALISESAAAGFGKPMVAANAR